MTFTPNSRSERAIAVCAKACSCILLAAAAIVILYFAFDGLENLLKASIASAILSVLFSLCFSGVLFLALYGAVRTSVEDYAIQIRILRRSGFLKLKQMDAKEFERLSAMERSIDEEIAERTKERMKHRKPLG